MDFSLVIDFFYQNDKQKHIIVSAFILIFDFIVRYYFIQNKQNWSYAFAFALRDTIMIWLFKEFIDLLWFWEASLWDMVANIIWFLFPIYLYYSYKESRKLWQKDILNYLDDSFRQLFISIKWVKKEVWEWVYHGFSYYSKLLRDKINEDAFSDIEMFQSKRKKKKEVEEWILSIKELRKVIKYLFPYWFNYIWSIYGHRDNS